MQLRIYIFILVVPPGVVPEDDNILKLILNLCSSITVAHALRNLLVSLSTTMFKIIHLPNEITASVAIASGIV